jgi:chromate transporter
MQAELQDKRQWVSKERFVEGLSLVNLLPGATATQLSIFLGYARGGWWGGVLAGLCYVLPAFGSMLALTMTYAQLGATPLMRGGLAGMAPVALGLFVVAVSRLGRAALTTLPAWLIALAAAAAAAWSPLGIAAILALAVGVGMVLCPVRRVGVWGLLVLLVLLAGMAMARGFPAGHGDPLVQASAAAHSTGLVALGTFFVKVGALTFGGGLTTIPWIQAQVVDHYHWVTPREFIDGFALSQFTPGPILMVAAYIGYQVAGLGGAVVAAIAMFLPSFLVMLSMLAMFERVRRLVWTRAAMQGVGPAVVGVLGVSLVRMAPHAVPNAVAITLLVGTLIAVLGWRISASTLMLTGAVGGVVWRCLLAVP